MNGIVRAEAIQHVEQLFVALSGASLWPIEIHEIGIGQPQKADVILHRYRVESCEIFKEGTRYVVVEPENETRGCFSVYPMCRWTASYYSKPPWGDKVLSSLNATIRLVKNAAIKKQGEGDLDVWKSAGYSIKYHSVKDSLACDIKSPNGIKLHVIMYQLFRGIEEKCELQKGESYDPSIRIVEVWSDVDQTEGHEKTLGAISWLNGLLEPSRVHLTPLLDKRHAIKIKSGS